MQKTLFLKLATIAALIFILMIALSMVRGVVNERKDWRNAAYQDIAQSYARNQTMLGPILVVPYEETYSITQTNAQSQQPETQTRKRRDVAYIIPETLKVTGRVKTQERYRGIYRVPTYAADMQLSGQFRLAQDIIANPEQRRILWEEAFLWVSLSDNRGIVSRPILNWQGKEVPFVPGTQENFPLIKYRNAGISAPLDLSAIQKGNYAFSFPLHVTGTEKIHWLPSAKDMVVTMASDWPHPSFSGNFLPPERKVGAGGFSATWKISNFNSNTMEWLRACAEGQCANLNGSAFGVGFMTPADAYQQTERAIKYGLMFISLTFLGFFLFETLKQLPIHPIQYGLVGGALAVFFQLLVSLSEYMAFAAAYAIAAAACIALLSVYVSAVLKSARRGIGFSSGIGVLYVTLYLLLQSQDNALLLGSLLIFGVLSTVMITTRHVDWYKVNITDMPPRSAE